MYMSGEMNYYSKLGIFRFNSKTGIVVNYFIRYMQIIDLKQQLLSQKK